MALVVRSRPCGRIVPEPDSIEDLPFMGLLHLKSDSVANRRTALVVQKYPHWPSLPKKGVRTGEDQRGESRPSSMWRTGFIGNNKMIQALPEQGQYF
ncbi:hypothetical protein AVEN_221868-1 [Araneus ventricosus]|uniref:Uncharacterized protein n=1 Tax=Araneus ventricosus TaxID=182803 RepID=A0A4Y2TXK1_ARAVE|nr:hypothetical protein AVEN_221868-1 [Araneus ventricosus]